MSHPSQAFSQQVAALLLCSRRNTSQVRMESDVPLAPRDLVKIGTDVRVSLEYRSDESTDDTEPSAGSPDESDIDTLASGSPTQTPPLGVRAPPGLELPPPQPNVTREKSASSGESSSICPHKMIVSSQGFALSPKNDSSCVPKAGTASYFDAMGLIGFPAKPIAHATGVAASRLQMTSHSNSEPFRSVMRKLASIEAERIVVVRKIDDFGCNARDLLKHHFSGFGVVEDAVVSQKDDRHAATGFVVMKTAEEAFRIFQTGLVQEVGGVSVYLTGYNFQVDDEAARSLRCGTQPSKNKLGKAATPQFSYIPEDNTLRANLRKLEEIDAQRILMVRRIRKFGLGGAQLLKTYFSQFGIVEDVLVCHSFDRRIKDHPRAKPTVRLADFGFIVMERAEDVIASFQHGLEQRVCGISIQLATFEHQCPKAA